MLDSYNREINYLRISVTDRCNLRCTYCMPEEGISLLHHQDILTYEEILEVARVAVQSGISKVRITGGEPLVRKDIVSLIRMLSNLGGISDLSLTTNGILLDRFARELAEAGLMRINISLDTIDPEKYRTLTRGGNVEDVFRGIKAAREAELSPIKINCVVSHNSDEPDAQDVKRYCEENGLLVRFIHQMDLRNGHFSVVEGGDGGNCSACTRLRLTANGKIKPCLFNDMEFDIRENGIENAIMMAIGKKPAAGTHNCSGHFYNIGG